MVRPQTDIPASILPAGENENFSIFLSECTFTQKST